MIATTVRSSCGSRSPEFLGEPVEDNMLGVDFLAVNFPSQNGTQSLVLRLGPLFLLFFAKDLVEHVLDRAMKRGHRVDTAHTRHPLLAVLLSRLEPFSSGHVVLLLPLRRIDLPHGHAFAIARGDDNLSFCCGTNRRLLLEVDLGVLGRLGSHVLQAVDRWRKAKDTRKRHVRFLVGFLHELRAAPFLQEVRGIALRHAQFRVQGHHFLTLRFPSGVDVAFKRRRAEGRNILSHTGLGQPLKGVPFVLNCLPAEECLLFAPR